MESCGRCITTLQEPMNNFDRYITKLANQWTVNVDVISQFFLLFFINFVV